MVSTPREVARFLVVFPAVEVEADPMVQQRAPIGAVHLLLSHAREAIVGRPAVQKVAIFREPFAECAQEPRGKTRFTEHRSNGNQLVSAVAAVLLTFASHSVHDRFDGRVVERVDRRVKQTLQGGIRAADLHGLRPGKHAPSHAHVPYQHGAGSAAHVDLQPAQRFVDLAHAHGGP